MNPAATGRRVGRTLQSRRPVRGRRLSFGSVHRVLTLRTGDLEHALVVLDRRVRVVEVVQQRPPPLIVGRVAEALGVILEPVPANEEDVAIRVLEAALELEVIEPGHGRDDGLGLFERHLELGGFGGTDVEDCQFEDHAPEATALVTGGPGVFGT